LFEAGWGHRLFAVHLLFYLTGQHNQQGIIDFNSSKSMKIQFHIRGFNVNARMRNYLGEPLKRLQSLIQITNAAVVLEHMWDKAPAFRAFVLLAVPGPDIHAEVREHTLEAAWLKMIAALRKQIERRKAEQLARVKSKRQQLIFTALWSKIGRPK